MFKFYRFANRLTRARLMLLGLMLAATAALASPPSFFDLRDFDWITPAKDQGQLGTCWAFANTTAFESSLLRQGIVTDPTSSLLDLSIWHLATHSGFEPDYTYPYNNWGGTAPMTLGYLTRGTGSWDTGPVPAGGGFVFTDNDALNAYPIDAVNNKENLLPYVPPVEQPRAYRLESARYNSFTGTGPASMDLTYRHSVQQQVMDHGGVVVDMYMDTNYFDSSTNTYLYTGSSRSNHEVVVAGWDDDKIVAGADAPGAWFIQNSWGADWGDDGYFWISYEDTMTASEESVSYVASTMDGYRDFVLQNQIYHPTRYIGLGEGLEDKAATRLSTEADVILNGFGLFSHYQQMLIELSIYTGWDNGPIGLLEGFTITETIEHIGYVSVYLPELLYLDANDEIYVVVNFGDEHQEPVALDMTSFADPDEHLSWIWNGADWVDLSEENSVFFFKGMVVIPEPGTILFVIILGGLAIVGRRFLKTRP